MAIATAPRAPEIMFRDRWVPEELQHGLRVWTPKTDLGKLIRASLHYLPVEMAAELVERMSSVVVIESSLLAVVIRTARSRFLTPSGLIEDYGEVSRKAVTTAGIDYLVDAMQNITEAEVFKYHALGTGTSAEASSETALVTELTTEYTGNVRATGTTTETGSGPAAYRTVATNTLDSGAPVIREHGVFSAASSGTLFDRSLFSAITLDGVAGDGLATTYTWTPAAGG